MQRAAVAQQVQHLIKDMVKIEKDSCNLDSVSWIESDCGGCGSGGRLQASSVVDISPTPPCRSALNFSCRCGWLLQVSNKQRSDGFQVIIGVGETANP